MKFLLNRWKQENFFKYALENQDINQTFGLTETGGYYKTSESKDELVLNRLELPAYQAAAEKLIARINENKPVTLGHKTKPLYITFEKSV